jgi:hypothetical protein
VASLPHSKLTALQGEVLDAFFQRERGFFLTGGAALAGFHLGHRMTDDLDLFTHQELAFERGRYVLADVAAAIGGELQVRQDAPGFKRLVLTRGDEGVVIDIVKDTSHQLHPDKLERDNIVIDPADEIQANKLAALVGRARIRGRPDRALACPCHAPVGAIPQHRPTSAVKSWRAEARYLVGPCASALRSRTEIGSAHVGAHRPRFGPYRRRC